MDTLGIVGMFSLDDGNDSEEQEMVGGCGMRIRAQDKTSLGIYMYLSVLQSGKKHCIMGKATLSGGGVILGNYRDNDDAMTELDKIAAFFEANPDGVYQMG